VRKDERRLRNHSRLVHHSSGRSHGRSLPLSSEGVEDPETGDLLSLPGLEFGEPLSSNRNRDVLSTLDDGEVGVRGEVSSLPLWREVVVNIEGYIPDV